MLAGRIFETNQKFREFRFNDDVETFEYDGKNIKPTNIFIVEKFTNYGDDNTPVGSTVTVKVSGYFTAIGDVVARHQSIKWTSDSMEQGHPLHWVPDLVRQQLQALGVLHFA